MSTKNVSNTQPLAVFAAIPLNGKHLSSSAAPWSGCHTAGAKLANNSWLCGICDTAGEVVFATTSMLTHQVFNSPPHMNRASFRLRQPYHLW
jgi:hypothetical protein